jgi:hypothetical protein
MNFTEIWTPRMFFFVIDDDSRARFSGTQVGPWSLVMQLRDFPFFAVVSVAICFFAAMVLFGF